MIPHDSSNREKRVFSSTGGEVNLAVGGCQGKWLGSSGWRFYHGFWPGQRGATGKLLLEWVGAEVSSVDMSRLS